MSDISVSIIIPVYHVEDYIERCLESVIHQTYNHSEIECILVDDCGKDRSIEIALDIVKNYSGNIRFEIIHNDRNSGLSVSRNNGIKIAKGKYLFFLDSDDFITSDCIEKLLMKSRLYPNVEVIKGNHIDKRDNSSISTYHIPLHVLNNSELMKLFFLTYIPCMAWNTLVSRELIVKYHLTFRPNLIYEDVLWSFMLFKQVKSFLFVPDITLSYEVNSNSIVNSKREDDPRYIESRFVILEELFRNVDKCYYEGIVIYISSMILQLLDLLRNNNNIHFHSKVVGMRNRLLLRTCRDCRFILALFELLMFLPFRMVFYISFIRKNYTRFSHMVWLISKTFSIFHF